jgi:hypothetical protein
MRMIVTGVNGVLVFAQGIVAAYAGRFPLGVRVPEACAFRLRDPPVLPVRAAGF